VPISEEVVAQVVSEVSSKMSDPNYSAVMVGGFVQTQPHTAQYITAHADEMGGAEAVVNTLFHAALLGLCFQRANNRTVRTMSFAELDHVADGDREQRLRDCQPALLAYLQTNVEQPVMQRVLMLVALAMDWVS
jgi:hypothetical protein